MVADDNAGHGRKSELKVMRPIGVLHGQWDTDYPAWVCVIMTVMMLWAVWTSVYVCVLGHRAPLPVARVLLMYFRRITCEATAWTNGSEALCEHLKLEFRLRGCVGVFLNVMLLWALKADVLVVIMEWATKSFFKGWKPLMDTHTYGLLLMDTRTEASWAN